MIENFDPISVQNEQNNNDRIFDPISVEWTTLIENLHCILGIMTHWPMQDNVLYLEMESLACKLFFW
jgi:hypothetical protein